MRTIRSTELESDIDLNRYPRIVEPRVEFDPDAFIILILLDPLDAHGLGGEYETVVFNRNPAKVTEDFLTVFERGIAPPQQVEIPRRSMRCVSPDLKKHGALQDELVPEA